MKVFLTQNLKTLGFCMLTSIDAQKLRLPSNCRYKSTDPVQLCDELYFQSSLGKEYNNKEKNRTKDVSQNIQNFSM